MAYDVAIGWNNFIDSSLLSADTGVNATTIENLKSSDVRELWQAALPTPALKADFGDQIPWGGTALINCNAVPGDQWQIRLSTSDPTGADGSAYDSGLISIDIDPIYELAAHFPPSPPYSGRYLRIDLEYSQAALPEAGRWFAGPVWYPSRAFSYGWRPLWRDPSRRTESLGQVLYIDRKQRQRGFGFTLRGITETEANNQVHELNRVCGTSRDILVCRDLSSANISRDTIWGLLEQTVSYPQEHPNHYVAEFEQFQRL